MPLIRCLLLYLILASNLLGQTSPFVFNHLDENDGLSSNLVNCFLKDSRGYLWIGTYDGLNRYDGAHFIVYKKTKDENSLVHNTVLAITEDKKGNIWGSTDNGIFCYNPILDKFTNYQEIEGLDLVAIINIVADNQGDIWATSYNHLLKFNKTKNKFEIAFEFKLGDLEVGIKYNGLVLNPDGRGLWLATNQGLFYYNLLKNQFTNSLNAKGNELFKRTNTSALCVTKHGHYWHYDQSKNIIIQFDPIKQKILHSIDISDKKLKGGIATLFEDSEHRLFYATWQRELGIIPYLQGDKVIDLEHVSTDDSSIASEFFWAAYEDDDKNIWFGTQMGISKFNTSKALYKFHWISKKLKNIDKYLAINNFTEHLLDSSLWITTTSSVIIHYYPKTDKLMEYDLKNYLPFATFKPSMYNQITITIIDGKVILKTPSGLYEWNEKMRKLKAFDILSKKYQDFICDFIVHNHDSLYYFSNGQYLIRYNALKNSLKPIKFNVDTLANGKKPYISNLYIGNNGKVWCDAGLNYLAYVNTQDQLQIQALPVKKMNKGIGYTYDIVQEGDSVIWIAKKIDGLYKYNIKSNKLNLYTEVDGLMYDHLMAVAVDNQANIWSIAYNKISAFIKSENRFYNITIPVTNHNYGYINQMSKLSNGHIFSNMKCDLVEFFPENIGAKPKIISPHISSVNIIGKEKLIYDSNELQLKPNENSLIIKFGLLTDRVTFPYVFKYKLEGVDNDWIENDNTEAVYNKLSPGKFVFRLIAKAKNGQWNSDEYLYTIEIQAPFYKTKWFILAIVFASSMLIYAFYKYRINEIEKTEQLKTEFNKQITESRMEALKAQMNPHFIFNCLNSINRYIIMNDAKTSSLYLTKFAKLIRLILDNSKFKKIPLANEIEALKLYIEMEVFRFEKKFTFDLNVDENVDMDSIMVPPLIIQPYVENAIWHGLLHKDEDGQLDINISQIDNILQIVVMDNGVGRAKAEEYKNDNTSTRKSYGLRLTEDRIQYYSGYESNEHRPEIIDLYDVQGTGIGTKVIIKIKTNNND